MRLTAKIVVVCFISCAAAGESAAQEGNVKRWVVVPTALVSRDTPPQQQVDLSVAVDKPVATCSLNVWADGRLLAVKPLGAFKAGANNVSVLLPEPAQAVASRWELSDGIRVLATTNLIWQTPRHWTLYVVKSAHVDIGLHDSQYKQRQMTVGFIDQARKLADRTADWPDASRYRYVIEGLWWWQNYPLDRSEQAADEIVEKYVKTGLFGIGASHSGNRTETYGDEELCRSAYCIQQMRDRWGLPMDTMLMVDNNGITWPLVTAYADAGIKYLGFFPNGWNPKTVGGSMIDVWRGSKLPHVFYWQGPGKKLVYWFGLALTTFQLVKRSAFRRARTVRRSSRRLMLLRRKWPNGSPNWKKNTPMTCGWCRTMMTTKYRISHFPNWLKNGTPSGVGPNCAPRAIFRFRSKKSRSGSAIRSRR